MENASKALIMAASILIGLLILSLAVYLFTSFGATSAQVNKQNEENQLNQFNSQFTAYVGKEGNTIYDVITAANLASENNLYYELPKISTRATGIDYYISVVLNNTKGNLSSYNGRTIESLASDKYQEIITQDLKDMVYSPEKDVKELTQYSCKVDISKTTGRVYLVTFTAK